MSKTLTRGYADYSTADLTVRELKDAGLREGHLVRGASSS